MTTQCTRKLGCGCSQCVDAFAAFSQSCPGGVVPKPRVLESIARSAHVRTSRNADLDAAGREIVRKAGLNVDGNVGSEQYRPLDCVYRDPKSKGSVFIGNLEAATKYEHLEANGIQRVVCCIQPPVSPLESNGIEYFPFPVADWIDAVDGVSRAGGDSEKVVVEPGAILPFFQPVFKWIDEGVASGSGVLIHCVAGAHRAGTAGVAYCMYRNRVPLLATLHSVELLRWAVDPFAFAELRQLLECLESDLGFVDHQRNSLPASENPAIL